MERLSWQVLTFLFASLHAFAGTMTYDCDSSLGSANTVGTLCNTLTTTVAGTYDSLFTNASATIYVTLANLGQNGDVADNVQIYNSVNYSSYYAALAANESGANDVTAVNSLGGCTGNCGNPVTGTTTVQLTGPLESALGIGTPTGICFITATMCDNDVGSSTYGSCTIGVLDPNCYNDIITVNSYNNEVALNPGSGQYDFITSVEHETDEALGTSSCLNVNSKTGAAEDGCSGNSVSAADLFRYSAPGTRSFLGTGGDQAEGSPSNGSGPMAYFSIDGGYTDLAQYNNNNNGDDYGDFWTTCTHVQDAVGCPGKAGVTIANDGGVELAMLDSVGYNLTPEPSSIVMVLGGVGAIDWMRRRRTQARG